MRRKTRFRRYWPPFQSTKSLVDYCQRALLFFYLLRFLNDFRKEVDNDHSSIWEPDLTTTNPSTFQSLSSSQVDDVSGLLEPSGHKEEGPSLGKMPSPWTASNDKSARDDADAAASATFAAAPASAVAAAVGSADVPADSFLADDINLLNVSLESCESFGDIISSLDLIQMCSAGQPAVPMTDPLLPVSAPKTDPLPYMDSHSLEESLLELDIGRYTATLKIKFSFLTFFYIRECC